MISAKTDRAHALEIAGFRTKTDPDLIDDPRAPRAPNEVRVTIGSVGDKDS